jgi:hypothetical protein
MSAAKPGARAACASRSGPSQAGSTRLAASSSAGGLSADRTGFKAKHPQEGEKQGQKKERHLATRSQRARACIRPILQGDAANMAHFDALACDTHRGLPVRFGSPEG